MLGKGCLKASLSQILAAETVGLDNVAQFSELMACGVRRSAKAGAVFDGERVSPARYQLGELGDIQFSELMVCGVNGRVSGGVLS